MAQFNNITVNNNLKVLGKIYNNAPSIGYGTCSTAAGTAQKIVTVETNWFLNPGSLIVINFSNTNTQTSPTLNINGTGAKSIWYDNGLISTTNLGMAGTKNKPSMYIYDGDKYIWMGWTSDGKYSGTIHKVAKTGKYNDLSTKPSGTLKFLKNSSQVGSSFSFASTGTTTVNVTVPTTLASLTNDSHYIGAIGTDTGKIGYRSGESSYGSASLQSANWVRQGAFIQLQMEIKSTASVASGSNLFIAQLTESKYYPYCITTGYGYSGSVALPAVINTDGTMTVRVQGTTISSGATIGIYFTYLISDSYY